MKNKVLWFVNLKVVSIVSVAIMAVIFICQADFKFGYFSAVDTNDVCILSDGTGYYSYLPQYIVYGENEQYQYVQKLQTKYPGKKFFSMVKIDHESNKVSNKFYIGTALVQSPFYYIAHKLHQWNDWDADGYQLGYRFSIQLAAIFYWLVGVYALFKLFTRLQFSRISILLGIILVSFGTNLNYYISFVPSMSHAYSFGMVACFLNVAHCWVHNYQKKYLLLAFFLLGLITVIRPVNFLVVLIVPFLFESFSHFWIRLKELIVKKWIIALISLALFVIPISVNLLVTYDQFGKFGLYTYGDEGFSNAMNPEFFNVLFSYHKGFFVYAPAMFSLLIALYYFVKHAKKYFLFGWMLCVLIWLYVISSWWCWHYGGGLGMRAMIEMLPLFLFPFLYLIKYGGKLINGITAVIIVLGIALYQLFQIQYNNSIIDCCEMNKEHFWSVFLKTDKRYQWMVDFEAKREKLDGKNLFPELIVSQKNESWKVTNYDSTSSVISFDESFPVVHLDSTEIQFQALIEGHILLNSGEINPFVRLEYYGGHLLIDETILTIGSHIEDPFHFEEFRLEVNHSVENKGIDRVKINFLDGGGNPIYKNRTITKFE